MHLSPDQTVFWQYGVFKLNATMLFTWRLMLVLASGSRLITRKLSTGLERSRWQNLLEIVVTGIEKQIQEVGLSQPQKYLGFLGTLFLFVATAGLCTVIPGFQPPTASLSTAAALALSVFVAVPFFGIEEQGLGEYLMSTHTASIPFRWRLVNSVRKYSSSVSFLRSFPNHNGSAVSRLHTTVRNLSRFPWYSSSTPMCRNGGFRRLASQRSKYRRSMPRTVLSARPIRRATCRAEALSQDCPTASSNRLL